MTLSRRSLLFTAAAAAGARLSMPIGARPGGSTTAAAARVDSGLVTGKPKALPYAKIAGFLSKDQIRWHHGSHYSGALKAFTRLDANPTGDHRTRIAKANSVVLHELYFDNMTARKAEPAAATQEALTKRFGSLDRWLADFAAAARSCRGWAVLAYHPINGKLYNIASDSHDDGPSWFGVPLVVVDMYEHSYYIDYQNKKADYVEGFIVHLDWTEFDRRLRACTG